MKSRLSFHLTRSRRSVSSRAAPAVETIGRIPLAGGSQLGGIARLLIALSALIDARVAGAASVPPWMQAQVGATAPEHDEKTDAVLLYSEVILSVQPTGKMKRLDRRVLRVLRPDGRGRGIVKVDVDSQVRVTSLRAWCVPAEGKIYEVGDKDSVESSLVGVENGELVTDLKTRLLRIPASVPGSLIGYEYAVELDERPYVMTDEWEFEDTVPVRETRYTLQLPTGWSYKSVWLNHAEVPSTSVGTAETQWVMRDLPAIKPEADMPPWHGIAGRLVISLVPPNGQGQGIQSWGELGTWYQNLARGRSDPSPQIKQKVAELTASLPTSAAKMQVLAAFVQSEVRYVAIELGIGGLQPHAAADVFAHRYGDCKDKATLLKSMLKEIGIDSYYFLVNTVRGAITESSPANLGFNHAILAIRLPAGSDESTLLAVATHPRLGKILFFDPTDPFTPFGRLTGALQSNYGLLVAPDGGELLKPPQLAEDLNAIQRTAKLTLDETGTLRGDVREVWSGDMASVQRQAVHTATQDTDRIKPVESVAASSFATFQIVKATVNNARLADRPFEWNYTLEVSSYAKTAGDLLLVRPRVLGTKSSGLLETKEPRRYPIEFEGPRHDTDVFEIELPPGYEVDELPPAVNLDYGFVSYHSKSESVGHALRYTRSFEVKEVSVPVTKAEQLKQFYRFIGDDERNSAVLKPVHP